ncbi:hypothetical protein KFL_002310050 [Klebsormidium nitens]|uniref:Uncharacterized protein n=1 Tax=Klebsormidium nitens TaxID=105231 RepID=A0A1Y1IB73_KLENI|nr:hypothetical protein KFL_002310050 [Klebsormidium nitens]|eukprot:GAQ85348.1 hypothetical protein KFL_002310050 [Klebsormidium nitens]
MSAKKKKVDAKGSPLQLEGKLRSFRKLYGAASLEQEKQKLLQRFQDRKDRALSSGNGAPASRNRPETASMHRSFLTGAKAGKGGSLRQRGEREWDQLPKRPQTAWGFAGMSGMNRRLHAERTVSWQDDAASPCGSDTERSCLSWDTEELGRVSSLGLRSEGASNYSETRASAGEVVPDSDGENDVEVVGRGHKGGQGQSARDVGESTLSFDRSDPEHREEAVLDESRAYFGQVLEGREESSEVAAEHFGDDEDCDVVIGGLCSVVESEEDEPTVSAGWSENAFQSETQLHEARSQAPDGCSTEGEAGSRRLSGATAEPTTPMAARLQSQSGCEMTSSQAEASHPGESESSLAPEASFDRVRPSSSSANLRYPSQVGLSASAQFSSDKWQLHSRPGRAFSAPSSRSASPSMQGARIEVRSRVAFSCQQYELYRDGVVVPRARMISRPEPSKTTVEQLKEWRQSERVRVWWYRHQKTVLRQRKLRLRKVASDVRWIQDRRKKEKAWHRAMRDEILRRAAAAERVKRAFRTVLTMVKARRRSGLPMSSLSSDDHFFKRNSYAASKEPPRAHSANLPWGPRTTGEEAARRKSSDCERRRSSDERGSLGNEGAAAACLAAELGTIVEENRDMAEGLAESNGQGGAAPSEAAAAASAGREGRAASAEGGDTKAAAAGGSERKALTKSMSMGGRRSISGDKGGPLGPGKKKGVVFGAPAGRPSEGARPGKLGVRGSKDTRGYSPGYGPGSPSVNKGAGKAGWLVPLYKSSSFVPMFDVPQEGPLLTSRKTRGLRIGST